MKKTKLFYVLFIGLIFLTSCTSDDSETILIENFIKWEINGTEYQNGNINNIKIQNTQLLLEEDSSGLSLFAFPANGQIENNTTYGILNDNVEINIQYLFEPSSIYDRIAFQTKSITVLEFNENYISGNFSASEAVLFNDGIGYTYGDPATGNYEQIDYNIVNGTFKIYR